MGFHERSWLLIRSEYSIWLLTESSQSSRKGNMMEPKKGSSLMRREMREEFAGLVGRQWEVGQVVVGGG